MGLLDRVPVVGDATPLGDRIAPPGVRPGPRQVATAVEVRIGGRQRSPVECRDGDSRAELERVLALPRRTPPALAGARAEAVVQIMTERLWKGVPANAGLCRCRSMGRPCYERLLPGQAWALWEMSQLGGLMGALAVGSGKTALDVLAALVVPDCRVAVLVVPPGLVGQLEADYLAWSQHFRVPSLLIEKRGHLVPGAPAVHVVPYSKFMRAEATDLLEQLRPDLVIADEAHKFRNDTATRARLFRYLKGGPNRRLVWWTGTPSKDSILDYHPLVTFALGTGSPMPLDPEEADRWAQAIDDNDCPAPPGDLLKLCQPGEHVQRGYHRRLVDTPGVVYTLDGGVSCSLVLQERKLSAPSGELDDHLRRLRAGDWVRPDGEELVDAMSASALARQLCAGFYYRWIFPKGEPPEMIDAWFSARKAWHKELRQKLERREVHLDSPLLCAKAAIRAWREWPDHDDGLGDCWSGPRDDGPAASSDSAPRDDLPRWKAWCWPRWRDLRDTVYHETEAVWVDDWLARDAAEWARKERGIVWYDDVALGERIAALAGLPLHGGGPDAEARIRAEDGSRSVVASAKAHGTGRDGLQRLFSRQLFAQVPSSGQEWEQRLGRLHRVGQEADEVLTDLYRHAPEYRDALESAMGRARYVQNTLGTTQKLLLADVTWRRRE